MISIRSYRFERLRNIIALRLQRIKKLEQEVVFCFEQGKLDQIQALMSEKDSILITNEQLDSFIKKWEKENGMKEDQVHT